MKFSLCSRQDRRKERKQTSICFLQTRNDIFSLQLTRTERRIEQKFSSRDFVEILFPFALMRSLFFLTRRSTENESTKFVYSWLFCRTKKLDEKVRRRNFSVKRPSFLNRLRSSIENYHRGVPIEYLCGSAMFDGLLFLVNRHVLIPRRDSKTLIEHFQEIQTSRNEKRSMKFFSSFRF